MLWITLDHPRMNKICIANVYKPPQGNVQSFSDIIEEQVILLNAKYTLEPGIFILGDCHIDCMKPRETNTKAFYIG